jgi:sugar O-acyltransferase (sialic acid O-acetyltransferase NeuD family)
VSTKPLIIFGAGDIAELAEYYFRTDARRSISAFTVDQAYLKEGQFKGRPVLPFESVDQEFPADQYDLFVAVSYSKLNTVRADKMREAAQKGYSLASYISSRAYVWDGFERAPNQFILEDNTLQPYCRVGQGVTLWSGNHVGHHSTIGAYTFVASHVVISGGVTIGDYCFVGVNATLRDHITVGQRCVIGAGAIVLADAPDESVFGAAPTRPSGVPSSRLRNI